METHLGALVIRPTDVRLRGLGFRMVSRPGVPAVATGYAGRPGPGFRGLGFRMVSRPFNDRYPRVAGLGQYETGFSPGIEPVFSATDVGVPLDTTAPPPLETAPVTYTFPDLPNWTVEMPGTLPTTPTETPMLGQTVFDTYPDITNWYQNPDGTWVGSYVDTSTGQSVVITATADGMLQPGGVQTIDPSVAGAAPSSGSVPTADGPINWGSILSGAAQIITAAGGVIRAVAGPGGGQQPVINGRPSTPTATPGVYRGADGSLYRIDPNGNPYPVASTSPTGGVSMAGLGLIAALGVGALLLFGGRKR